MLLRSLLDSTELSFSCFDEEVWWLSDVDVSCINEPVSDFLLTSSGCAVSTTEFSSDVSPEAWDTSIVLSGGNYIYGMQTQSQCTCDPHHTCR